MSTCGRISETPEADRVPAKAVNEVMYPARAGPKARFIRGINIFRFLGILAKSGRWLTLNKRIELLISVLLRSGCNQLKQIVRF